MDKTVYQRFEQAVIDAATEKKEAVHAPDDPDDSDNPPEQPPTSDDPHPSDDTHPSSEHQGKLILDATVAPQQIRYPTDLSLLNEAREISESIIDTLHTHRKGKKKPRTYRQRARKDYLAIAKQKRPRAKTHRKALRKQLNYLKRNLKHINHLWDEICPLTFPCHLDALQPFQPLGKRQLKQLWVIEQLYQQQQHMYDTKTRHCDERIVSIHQPHVRPIVRGKPNKPAEFGAKLSASLTGDGIACLDAIRWNAFNEGQDLETQVENYKKRHGHYPEVVLADPIYGTRSNRNYLKKKNIRYGGKPLGRPKKMTQANKEAIQQEKRQRTEDYRQRIPIEGKFGQGKNGYNLNQIKAKTQKTSESWIAAIFFIMNLLVLSRIWDFLAQNKWKPRDSFIITVKNIINRTGLAALSAKLGIYSPGWFLGYFVFE
jgi:hypothetical protein